MKAVHLLAALAVVASGTGCITFNGNELPKVALGDATGEPSAVVALEVGQIDKTMNGSHTDMGANFNEGMLGKITTSQIAQFWKAKHLIRDFGFPGDLDIPATHKLIVDGVIDERGSLAGAFFTGLTLYLLPSSSDIVYDLDVKLERLSDGETYETKVKNSFGLVQQILFAPVTVFGSVAWGSYGAGADRSLYLYEEFLRQGAFEGFAVRSAEAGPTPEPEADKPTKRKSGGHRRR